MIKQFIKLLIKDFIFYSSLWRLRLLQQGKRSLTILMYHSVVGDDDQDLVEPGIVVSRKTFELQMQHLNKYYTIINFNDLDGIRTDNIAGKKPYAIVTFDDGWQNNFTHAFPVLQKEGVKAVIFLCSGFIGKPGRFWFDSYYRLIMINIQNIAFIAELSRFLVMHDRQGIVFESTNASWAERNAFASSVIDQLKCIHPDLLEKKMDELKSRLEVSGGDDNAATYTLNRGELQLLRAGGVSFGSHGKMHYIFTVLQYSEMKDEIVGSKSNIEGIIGEECKSLAFPNGDYSEEVLSVVLQAGYRYAVTTEYGINAIDSDPLTLKRIGIHREVGADLPSFVYRLLFH